MAWLSGGCDMARPAAARPKCSSSARQSTGPPGRRPSIRCSLSVGVGNGLQYRSARCHWSARPSSAPPPPARGRPGARPRRGVPRRARPATGDLDRAVRRGRGDVRADLQHPGAAAGVHPHLLRLRRAEHALGLADHDRSRRRPARGRAGVRGRGPDPADPLLADGVRGGGGRLRCSRRPGTRCSGLRLLQGVTLAGYRRRDRLPARGTPPGTHARAAGLYIGGTAIGGMTGRLVTGPIADVASWRWALAAIAAVGLVCAVVVGCCCRHRATSCPCPRAPGPGRHARRALGDPALLALYAIGACSVGAFVASSTRWASGSPPRRSTSGSAPPGWSSSSIPSAPSAPSSPAGWRPLLPPGGRAHRLRDLRRRGADHAARVPCRSSSWGWP